MIIFATFHLSSANALIFGLVQNFVLWEWVKHREMREDELNVFGSLNECFYMATICYLAAYSRDFRAETLA